MVQETETEKDSVSVSAVSLLYLLFPLVLQDCFLLLLQELLKESPVSLAEALQNREYQKNLLAIPYFAAM